MTGRRNHYTLLLASLLPVLFLSALARELGGIRSLLTIGFGTAAVIGIWGLAGDRVWFRRGIVLSGGIIVSSVAAETTGSVLLSLLNLALLLTFFLGAFLLVIGNVLRERPIDRNKIVGAFCAYLLLGMAWAILYQATLVLEPGSFGGLSAEQPGFDLVYFSFVTLTTLGYGDVVPLHPLARSAVVLEALVGQFYIAVVVAGLISLLIQERPSSGGSADAAE